jgi:hypothetical protein
MWLKTSFDLYHPRTSFDQPRSSHISFSVSSAAPWVVLCRHTPSRDGLCFGQPPCNGRHITLGLPHIANDSKRDALGLSIGATILFLVFMLYWNRLLARLVFWLLRLKTWDTDSNGSIWLSAGMRPSTSGNCVDPVLQSRFRSHSSRGGLCCATSNIIPLIRAFEL